jgi:predicted ATPase
MKIKLKNLGAIKQAEFEIGDLTIICGKNNTGKTYTTYDQGLLSHDLLRYKRL